MDRMSFFGDAMPHPIRPSVPFPTALGIPHTRSRETLRSGGKSCGVTSRRSAANRRARTNLASRCSTRRAEPPGGPPTSSVHKSLHDAEKAFDGSARSLAELGAQPTSIGNRPRSVACAFRAFCPIFLSSLAVQTRRRIGVRVISE